MELAISHKIIVNIVDIVMCHIYSNPPIGRKRYNNKRYNNKISNSLDKKMNILDKVDDFINQKCIVKRNKKNHSMSK